MLTCVALVALTVVFAAQFEQLSADFYSAKEKVDAVSKDLESKSLKLSELERTSEVQRQREDVLRNMLGRK